jgi:hypothetical protein
VIRILLAACAILALAASGPSAGSGTAETTPSDAQASAPVPSAAELDQLLAPIALYPDQLLAQMLLCASNPGTIGALSEWLRSHESVKGTELQNAAAAAGFTESFVAIAIFPDVVNMMASQADWTARLGRAFTADRTAVFDSIQRLRKKARDAGALKTTPQQEVENRTTASGENVIVIEPANPQVVYVPQYNPQVVYTQPTTSTVVVQQESHTDEAVAGLIGFTAGIAIGAAIDNDYYYGPYGWHGGGYMYNDAWDDYYDAREDAREDWTEHREDIAEERGDVAKNAQEQRTERQETRGETRTDTQAQRTERQQSREQANPEAQAQREQRRTDAQASAQSAAAKGSTQEARGYSSGTAATATTRERSGTGSDAFSGYSSGRSERAASQRGQRSRSSSRSGGSRRR